MTSPDGDFHRSCTLVTLPASSLTSTLTGIESPGAKPSPSVGEVSDSFRPPPGGGGGGVTGPVGPRLSERSGETAVLPVLSVATTAHVRGPVPTGTDHV